MHWSPFYLIIKKIFKIKSRVCKKYNTYVIIIDHAQGFCEENKGLIKELNSHLKKKRIGSNIMK